MEIHSTIIPHIESHNENLDTLESLIDHVGIAIVIDLLAEVASAKSDHLRANWQDEKSADTWDKIAVELLRAKLRVDKIRD